MIAVIAALEAEWLKLRRSRLPWFTLAACTLGTAVGGLFMYISVNPERARALGLSGAKAQLSTVTPDWAGYLGLLAQIVGFGGVGIFGMAHSAFAVPGGHNQTRPAPCGV